MASESMRVRSPRFGSSVKPYPLEYSLVKDLGNLDSLSGKERVLVLSCFDVLESPDAVERRGACQAGCSALHGGNKPAP